MNLDAAYLLKLIHNHRLAPRHKELRNLVPLLEMGLVPDGIARAYMHKIQPLIEEQERRPNLLHQVPSLEEIYPQEEPPVVLGHAAEDPRIPIGLTMRGATNVLIAGTSGYGKTAAFRQAIGEIMRWNEQRDRPVVVLILDRKLDYIDLPALFGEAMKCYVFGQGLRLGLQPPIGVPVNIWINRLSTILCARLGLIAGWMTVARLLTWLTAAMNPEPSNQLLFPSFRFILEATDRIPRNVVAEKDSYWGSVRQALYAADLAGGDTFDTFSGLDIERDLIGQGCGAVIVIPNIDPPWMAHFITELLLEHLLLGRIYRGYRGNDPDVLVILDESDDLVSEAAESHYPQGSLSSLSRVARLGRESKIGLGIGVGSLGGVSKHVRSAMTYSIVCRMTDGQGRVAAAQLLDLPQGADGIIPSLVPGETLFRGPQWPHAILTKINFVQPSRLTQPARIDTHPFVPGKPLDEMPHVLKALEEHVAEHGKMRQRQIGRLRHDAKAFLKSAAQKPLLPAARVFEMIGCTSRSTQKTIREQLQQLDFIEACDARIGRRNVCLFELTDKAWELLGQPSVRKAGRGNLIHRTFQAWVAEGGKRLGLETHLEFLVGNHPVDVAWELADGRLRAFECCVRCTDNILNHLLTIFRAGGDTIETAVIVAAQKKLLDELRKTVETCQDMALYLDRIRFESIEQYEKEL